VQLSGFSVWSEPVPIEDAVCGIRALLNLSDNKPRADSVTSAGRDEVALSGCDFDFV